MAQRPVDEGRPSVPGSLSDRSVPFAALAAIDQGRAVAVVDIEQGLAGIEPEAIHGEVRGLAILVFADGLAHLVLPHLVEAFDLDRKLVVDDIIYIDDDSSWIVYRSHSRFY